MTQLLNTNQINYILFHLKQHVELDGLEQYFCFDALGVDQQHHIFFPLSKEGISIFDISFNSEHVPVLYPVSSDNSAFSIKGGNLYFHHDFLKSAFYLLSAYQELNSEAVDAMGRFKYDGSIQQQLGWVRRPLVNYYFEIIIQGLELFGQENGIDIKRKRLFESFGFMLTHDVDRIDYYHWRETVYKWLQVVGLKPLHYNKKRLFKAAVDAILPTLFPGYKPDPWWNFKELRRIEKDLGLKSVWYFLNRDGSPHDAKYHLEEKRIKDLIATLKQQGCEVGLHGSIRTADNQSAMQEALTRLQKVSGNEVVGTRQHFLKFHFPRTFEVQQAAGLRYDTTMAYAEHEGFRNSYCYPFRPYDHDRECMMDIWELPLTVMDTTLFGYRKLDYKQIESSIEVLINECERFGGLFVMLWHNCNFDEYQYPGINAFYKKLLQQIVNSLPVLVTGKEVISKV